MKYLKLWAVCSCFFAIIGFFIHNFLEILHHSKKITRNVQSCKKILQNYFPQTGDIVLLQMKAHGLSNIDGMNTAPTHAGLLWVRNGIPYLIENTVYNDTYVDHFYGRTNASNPNGGVRLINFYEVMNKTDGFLSVRALQDGKINEVQLEQELIKWGKFIEFDQKNIRQMNLVISFAFVVRQLFKNVSNMLFYKLQSLHRPKNQMYCSEFICVLLKNLGHVKSDFKDYWGMTPFCFSSSTRTIDKLSKESMKPLMWKEDQVLLCPN
jgi:hypothetical protein